MQSPRIPVLALVLFLASSGVASAQTAATAVDASVGIDGWVDPTSTFDVTVVVESDVLFDGEVRVSKGSIVVSRAAQVPAGSVKEFVLTLPPSTGDGSSVLVELVDRDGDATATTRITPRYPEEEVLVGVAGGVDASAFDRLRTPVVDRPLVAVEIGDETDPGVLHHLVTPAFDARAEAFARDGGTVITEEIPGGLAAPVGAVPGVAGSAHRLEAGTVFVVERVADVEAYLGALRAPELGTGVRDIWMSPDQALGEAASNAGEGGVPELPWLLSAILGYAFVLGPVNFWILRRLHRRDWAWFTVPAISVVALGAFWLAGGQRLGEETITHASVIVGGDEPIERTSVVMAVGGEGSYALGLADDGIVYPATLGNRFDQFGRPLPTSSAEVSGSVVTFDLQQLGFAGAHVIRASAEPADAVVVSLDEGSLAVENGSDLDFWAWGFSVGGSVTVAPAGLAPGESGTLAGGRDGFAGDFAGPEFGFFLGDAVANERRLWNDDRTWRILSPLGNAAQVSLGSGTDAFFFGFTESYTPEVSLDGAARTSKGNTIVVVPIETPDAASGRLVGTVLDIGNGFLEGNGAGGIGFITADEVWFGFRLPEVEGRPTAELVFDDRFGIGFQPGVAAYDWDDAVMVPIEFGAQLGDRFIDPLGSIVVRMSVAGDGGPFQPGEIPLSPQSVAVVWGES